MSALAVDISGDGEQLLVTLEGNLDVATIPEFRRCMVDVRRRDSPVVIIDASDLVFVDVSGMRAMTAEMTALRQGRRNVFVENVRPQVQHLAKLLFAQAQLGLTCVRR